LLTPHPPTSPLFPYTTLFRSRRLGRRERQHGRGVRERGDRIEAIEQERRRECARLVRGQRRLQARLHRREARRLRHDRHRGGGRSEEHTSELQSLAYLVCRLL